MSTTKYKVLKRVEPNKKNIPRNFPDFIADTTKLTENALAGGTPGLIRRLDRFIDQFVNAARKTSSIVRRTFPVGKGPKTRILLPGNAKKPSILAPLEGRKPYKKMTGKTRRTGGVLESRGRLNPDGSVTIEHGGVIQLFPGGASKFRKAKPSNDFARSGGGASSKSVGNSELKRPNPKTGKLELYEKAHLWGHGFGDEARDGIMFAPKEFNQFWQNQGIEDWIRELSEAARSKGGNLVLRAKATSISPRKLAAQEIKDGVQKKKRVLQSGNEHILESATYELFVETPAEPGVLQKFLQLDFEIPPPWEPSKKLKLPFNPGDPATFPPLTL